MGCLNSKGQFKHWFANIHLSGPCNRACYFCIGQHMMALDNFENLSMWPLAGIENFVATAKLYKLKEICLTGTNTDPLLYRHHGKLTRYLRHRFPGVPLALRTNAAHYQTKGDFKYYNKASITVCSFNLDIYRKMMGKGGPPDVRKIVRENPTMDIKVNVVLGPENNNNDLLGTLDILNDSKIERVNLREPYGQPHIGDPLKRMGYVPEKTVLGMPVYRIHNMEVTYWDVHYVEVESLNLYANGRVSVDYPITRGHTPNGEVHDQSYFPGGRIREQWAQITSAKTSLPGL